MTNDHVQDQTPGGLAFGGGEFDSTSAVRGTFPPSISIEKISPKNLKRAGLVLVNIQLYITEV